MGWWICTLSVWCFAMEHYSKLWNRVKKNKDGKTPQETLEDELLDVNDPRRSPPVKLEHLPYFIFGSLAIVYKSNPIQNKSDLLSGKLSFAPRCCFANVSYVQLWIGWYCVHQLKLVQAYDYFSSDNFFKNFCNISYMI